MPSAVHQQVMADYHSGSFAGHFSGPHFYKTLSQKWRWKNMYRDTQRCAQNCPQQAIVDGIKRKLKPPLHLIPTEHPFQTVGVDIMELRIFQ